MTIECSECKQKIVRWDYEIKKLKNLKIYTCRQCKYKKGNITKICSICKKEYKGLRSQIEKQTTCSYACSNKQFRTGPNNGNWSGNRYRSICKYHHKMACIICNEDKIVAVHHFDHNHNNNDPHNLVPLCPTHHQYCHSNYYHLIQKEIETYVDKIRKMITI